MKKCAYCGEEVGHFILRYSPDYAGIEKVWHDDPRKDCYEEQFRKFTLDAPETVSAPCL